jgi:orotate phosphoribosyltransferase
MKVNSLNKDFNMKEGDIKALFVQNNALLNGHFLLSSGLHSDIYFQSALVLQYPKIAEQLGQYLASLIKNASLSIDTVVSPALGGLIIGQETAKALGARAIFTERVNGEVLLRRGFSLNKNEKVLIVEDVITTGLSTQEVIKVASNYGADILAVSSLVDRSSGKANFSVLKFCLLSLEVKTYNPQDCPMCKNGSLPIKPGSRINK